MVVNHILHGFLVWKIPRQLCSSIDKCALKFLKRFEFADFYGFRSFKLPVLLTLLPAKNSNLFLESLKNRSERGKNPIPVKKSMAIVDSTDYSHHFVSLFFLCFKSRLYVFKSLRCLLIVLQFRKTFTEGFHRLPFVRYITSGDSEVCTKSCDFALQITRFFSHLFIRTHFAHICLFGFRLEAACKLYQLIKFSYVGEFINEIFEGCGVIENVKFRFAFKHTETLNKSIIAPFYQGLAIDGLAFEAICLVASVLQLAYAECSIFESFKRE